MPTYSTDARLVSTRTCVLLLLPTGRMALWAVQRLLACNGVFAYNQTGGLQREDVMLLLEETHRE